MNRPNNANIMLLFICIGLLILVLLFPVPRAHASTIYEINGLHDCIYFMQHGQSCWEITVPNGPFQTGNNWQIDVFTPTGACNITGKMINSNGACTSPSFILSNDNMTTFRTNISVLAVKAVPTTDHPNQNYCPLAQWTYDNQEAAFKKKYENYTSLIIPTYCAAELGGHTVIPTVPEFSSFSMVVLGMSLLLIVGFTYIMKQKKLT